jgi:translation elongation factor EF-Tu-like GTPase
MAERSEIGKITHYYSKIGVAVVALSAKLKVGDEIEVVGGSESFKQRVESLQINHKNVDSCERGQEVGLKLDGAAKEGDIVYKVS